MNKIAIGTSGAAYSSNATKFVGLEFQLHSVIKSSTKAGYSFLYVGIVRVVDDFVEKLFLVHEDGMNGLLHALCLPPDAKRRVVVPLRARLLSFKKYGSLVID